MRAWQNRHTTTPTPDTYLVVRVQSVADDLGVVVAVPLDVLPVLVQEGRHLCVDGLVIGVGVVGWVGWVGKGGRTIGVFSLHLSSRDATCACTIW